MTLPNTPSERTSQQDKVQYIWWFYYERVVQLLAYSSTWPCKDVNKNATWNRSLTLDLECQNIEKKNTPATFTLPFLLMEH